MTDRNEAALARLSLAAFAIDALLISLLAYILMLLFDDLFQGESFIETYSLLPALVIAFFFHFFFVEIILAGRSVGRLCLGLSVWDCETNDQPNAKTRVKRFSSDAASLGLRNFHFNKLPSHNKRADGYLHSDWVGSAPIVHKSTSQTAERQQKQKANVQPGQAVSNLPTKISGGLQVAVVQGPDAGKRARLDAGKSYHMNGVFLIGRAEDIVDLSLTSDKAVSRVHCCILLRDNALYIIDGKEDNTQGSTHGTYVNNRKISSSTFSPLQIESQIQIGNSIVRLQ